MRLLKRNVSTLLLLTPLELSYDILDYEGLVEAFVADVDREDLENTVICLFRIGNIKDLQKFIEDRLSVNPTFIEDYDYNGYVAVAFKFPEKYLADYELIKESKYSQVSEGFKKLYGEKMQFRDERTGKFFEGRSTPYRIIYRNKHLLTDMANYLGISEDDLEGQEAWKRFDYNKETLDISNYETVTIAESFTEA